MYEEKKVNSKTRIIARNGSKFIATNDEKITINDIYSKAFMIDENGDIVEDNLLIGVITKFGYWEAENIIFENLKSRLIVEKHITNALLGFAVSEIITIIKKVFDTDIDSFEDLELEISKLDFDISGYNTVNFVSNFSNNIINNQVMMDEFIIQLKKVNSYNKDYTNNILKLIDKYNKEYIIDFSNKDLKTLIYNALYCLFSQNLNSHKICDAINVNDETLKMGIYICINFLKEILNSNDKINSFNKIISCDYNDLFSFDTINFFELLLKGNYKEFMVYYSKITNSVVKTLFAVFYSILCTDNYEDAVFISLSFNENNMIISSLVGFIAGIIYGEDELPIDILINLNIEEGLRVLSSKLSREILI